MICQARLVGEAAVQCGVGVVTGTDGEAAGIRCSAADGVGEAGGEAAVVGVGGPVGGGVRNTAGAAGTGAGVWVRCGDGGDRSGCGAREATGPTATTRCAYRGTVQGAPG